MLRRVVSIALAAMLAAVAGHAKSDARAGWSLFLDFTFTAENDAISDTDRTKPRRVAHYLENNPKLRVGLDGMNQNRVSSVRVALIHAGIEPARIQVGAFGEPRLRGERRVLVMIGP